MENFKRHIQKTDWTRGRGMVDSRNTTGMFLGRQRRANVRCNKFGQDRLEWKC